VKLINGLTESLLKLQQKDGAFYDPIHNVKDPRPTAEISKALLELGKKKQAIKGFDWILKQQLKNGAWEEVFTPQEHYESCVATGVVGRILVRAFNRTKKKAYLNAALKAADYVLSKEFSSGYFIKSYYHYADVLNVNATCAAFFHELFEATKKEQFREARDRAIFNTVRYQFKDGALPYATPMQTHPYEWHLNLRCPHYHALTLYFLLLADPKLENPYMKIAAKKAIRWLQNSFNGNRADWAKDRLMFSIGVTGAYGYSAYCFDYFNNKKMLGASIFHLEELLTAQGFNRYEPTKFGETLTAVLRELFEWNAVSPAQLSWAQRFARVKRILRRNWKERPNTQFSLYYSAQILDCLTELRTKS